MTNTRRLTRALTFAAVVPLLDAPSPDVRPADRSTEAAPDSTKATSDVMLRVTNDNWLTVHVYALRVGGNPVSIGVVQSFTSETFPLPTQVMAGASDLRILADPIGGTGAYLSEPVIYGPTDEIHLRVANNLNLSTVTVRRSADR